MFNPDPNALQIAVRPYPSPAESVTNKKSRRELKRPKGMLVFDTETRIDETQRLTFGSYRFFQNGECLEEGIFYADDLSIDELDVLKQYVRRHRADVAKNGHRELKILTRSEFLDRFYKAAYKGRCLVIAFNLPFDLSRLAFDFGNARGRFAGGFSLGLWTYIKNNIEHRDRHRPRVCIKHIDGKRALKGLVSKTELSRRALIDMRAGRSRPHSKNLQRVAACIRCI